MKARYITLLFLLAQAISPALFAQVLSISDEFNRTCSMQDWLHVNDTEGWNATHLQSIDIDTTKEGALTIRPYTTGWYANYRSNLMYKNISGDFSYTIHVEATDTTGLQIPGSAYSLAGAMVRSRKTLTTGSVDWVAGEENYVFLSLGFAAGGSGPHFEVKNTINSNSNLEVISIPVAEATIKLVRINNAVIALYRLPGSNWLVRRRYDRPDMPDTLQVGNVVYTDWNKVNTYTPAFLNAHTINEELDPDPSSDPNQPFAPNIIGEFEYGRFENVTIPVSYEGLDFSDPSDVTDAEIINLFGYEPNTIDLLGWKIWSGKNSDFDDPENWSGGTAPITSDSIIIPNCSCPEIVFPTVSTGSYTFQSMIVEAGGNLSVGNNVVINIDLSAPTAQFRNDGVITNNGIVEISNSAGKLTENTGVLTNEGVGEFRVNE